MILNLTFVQFWRYQCSAQGKSLEGVFSKSRGGW